MGSMLRWLLAVVATAAALVAQSAPAQAAVGDPGAADVVLATAPAGQAYRFPDIVRLHDATLLAVAREGSAHVSADGRIMALDSRDGGRTWSAARVAIDTPYDDRDPKVTQLRDGTVLLSFFATDESVTPNIVQGTFVARSTDEGRTWSTPTRIGTQMTGATPSSPTGWAASHGEITELPNGDVLAPLYGTLPGDPRQRATVVRSRDGGRTWDAAHETTLGVGSISYQEPVLTVLRGGELVALIRTTSSPQVAYIARSDDGGHAWTAAQPTDIPASSHHLLATHDGAVLVTYGKADATGRPTAGRLITDPRGSWDGYPETLLYDSGNSDQANPSSAEVRPGRFLTLGYDVDARTLIGVFSAPGDYA